ncbi:Uncharacterised protein [Legionella quateirensis]|uniref:Uncharacterized protein n=1 Tax=Legionella quateirensis TaxID=45072 RepID=A0A378KTG1_9GAMM|nr:Uncharacterised protein [Legionella quateirensis]
MRQQQCKKTNWFQNSCFFGLVLYYRYLWLFMVRQEKATELY